MCQLWHVGRLRVKKWKNHYLGKNKETACFRFQSNLNFPKVNRKFVLKIPTTTTFTSTTCPHFIISTSFVVLCCIFTTKPVRIYFYNFCRCHWSWANDSSLRRFLLRWQLYLITYLNGYWTFAHIWGHDSRVCQITGDSLIIFITRRLITWSPTTPLTTASDITPFQLRTFEKIKDHLKLWKLNKILTQDRGLKKLPQSLQKVKARFTPSSI